MIQYASEYGFSENTGIDDVEALCEHFIKLYVEQNKLKITRQFTWKQQE